MINYVHKHIIRINYNSAIDVRDTEPMISFIRRVITKETGVEPEIEEYLL